MYWVPQTTTQQYLISCSQKGNFVNMGNEAENENDKRDSFYHLINLKGEGVLVDLVKEARENYAELDKVIKCKIEPFLYNEGNGKQQPIGEIIRYRSKSRPNFHFKKVRPGQSEENGRELEEMKFTCWRLDKRGIVGETGLHVCLLMATEDHSILAKR